MKKSLFMVLMSFVAICLFALPSVYGTEKPAVPADGAQMDFFKADKNNRVVTFNHSTHAAFACEDCHHMANEHQYSSCANAGCHDIMDQKDKSAASYYNAIHGKGTDKIHTCLACHRDMTKKDEYKAKKKEMTSCAKSACHP